MWFSYLRDREVSRKRRARGGPGCLCRLPRYTDRVRPYRDLAPRSGPLVVRVNAVWRPLVLGLVAALLAIPLILVFTGVDPLGGMLVVALVGFLVVALLIQPNATVMALPLQERIRVIRRAGTVVESATLRLSRDVVVDTVVCDGTTWIALTDGDGRFARVAKPRDDAESVAVRDELERMLRAATAT